MPEHWPIDKDTEPAGERCGGTVYRAERSGRLGPRQIRGARFTVRRFGRRGVDPDEVRRFLARVADEVGDLHAELAATRDEANRLRFALREWQAGFPYGNEAPHPLRPHLPVGDRAASAPAVRRWLTTRRSTRPGGRLGRAWPAARTGRVRPGDGSCANCSGASRAASSATWRPT